MEKQDTLNLPHHIKFPYPKPSEIQQKAIPTLIAGHDLIAKAKTGSGKTASFCLPLLAKINLKDKSPQALIITPTRELAQQVAQALKDYAKESDMKGFFVTPIYGGQDYKVQNRFLKKGTPAIVGTPGRLMDSIEKKNIDLSKISCVILDEADEMLNMGFVEDIEWILSQIHHKHQTGLFSATMPQAIKKIANKYLTDPQKIEIESKKGVSTTITQKYILTPHKMKENILLSYLQTIELDAAVIFTKTKIKSQELSDLLQNHGYKTAALNSDIKQSLRERVISQLKDKSIDIIVATDLAARGIDVSRINHVINFDIPGDSESYIHRIGRTGRAGRSGQALLLLAPQESRQLGLIEKTIGQPIEQISAPSLSQIINIGNEDLKNRALKILDNSKKLDNFLPLVNELESQGYSSSTIAAALAYILQQPKISAAQVCQDLLEKELNSFKKQNSKNKGRSSNRNRARQPYNKKTHHKKHSSRAPRKSRKFVD